MAETRARSKVLLIHSLQRVSKEEEEQGPCSCVAYFLIHCACRAKGGLLPVSLDLKLFSLCILGLPRL